jgi:hypothetical protein
MNDGCMNNLDGNFTGVVYLQPQFGRFIPKSNFLRRQDEGHPWFGHRFHKRFKHVAEIVIRNPVRKLWRLSFNLKKKRRHSQDIHQQNNLEMRVYVPR